jgi:hypothetical protein
MTEGSCRMRKKLTPNPHFCALYPVPTGIGAGREQVDPVQAAGHLDSDSLQDAKEHLKLYSKWRQEDQARARFQILETLDGLLLFGNNLLALFQVAGGYF